MQFNRSNQSDQLAQSSVPLIRFICRTVTNIYNTLDPDKLLDHDRSWLKDNKGGRLTGERGCSASSASGHLAVAVDEGEAVHGVQVAAHALHGDREPLAARHEMLPKRLKACVHAPSELPRAFLVDPMGRFVQGVHAIQGVCHAPFCLVRTPCTCFVQRVRTKGANLSAKCVRKKVHGVT